MPQPIIPPRMIIRPAKNLKALSGLLFSFRSCCDDPTPGVTRHHSVNPFVDGWDIYCENCDTTLATIHWNPEDMREYANQENTRKMDEAAADNPLSDDPASNYQDGPCGDK